MMALTQENVHYTLNSGPGVMNEQVEQGTCADLVIFSHQLILQSTEWIQWFYYRGEEGVQLLPGDGGVQRNPYNL